MSGCQFTIQARLDLDEICSFIASDNPLAAAALVNLLEDKCHLLARHPELGRKRDELLPSLRGFPVQNYLIFYRPSENGIQVIRVLHGARDIPTEFE